MNPLRSSPLWLTADRKESLGLHIAAGQPTALAILECARRAAAADTPEAFQGERAVAHAMLAAAGRGDARARAAAACDAFVALVDLDAGNLGRANQALIGSVVRDACCDMLDPERRFALHRALLALCRSFRVVDTEHGDPHTVTNNHWAVSHSGAALAAMAVHGLPVEPDGPPLDMGDDIAWACGRVKAFLGHHGDRGLYHEGLGYQFYAAALWLPCLLAARNALGVDWLAEFPHLRQAAASLYAGVAARRAGARVGVRLSWNDDGSDWCDRNSSVLLLAAAPPEQAGALRWLYDRLNGIAGDGRFHPDHAGLFFALLYYPYDAPSRDPNGVLPSCVVDSRQGLCLMRNRYRDADDAVVGAYARVAHAGGHAHDDAGSIRCMALGHDWILGGGQARGEAEYQSLVTAADSPRAKPFGCGAVIASEATETGGVFGIDLRRPVIGYAERWLAVDFSGAAANAAVALALLDLFDDHLARDWHWNLSFGGDLAPAAHADGAGFELTAADGAHAVVRFLGPCPVALAFRRMRDASRTYQGGRTVAYPGGPYAQARFAHAPHNALYAVILIGRGPLPDPELDGGLDVRLGGHTWRRPFGAAIPASFDVNRGGTLCRYPNGEPTRQ